MTWWTGSSTVWNVQIGGFGSFSARMGLICPYKWGSVWNVKCSKGSDPDMSDWEQWVSKVTGGATARQVAERIGKSHTTALRWMHDGRSPEQVIQFAIAYNADIIQALVAAGWVSETDLVNLNLGSALRSLTEVELAGELYRRALAAQRRENPLKDDPFAADRV